MCGYLSCYDFLKVKACEVTMLVILFPFIFPFLAGGESQSYAGRVISVKWGDYTRRIGIDATAEAIKDAIKSAFGLRTRRAFWLEDEYQIIRSLDRDMPLGNYILHVDEGKLLHMYISLSIGK